MKVLIISPHTDDGELGCGATIARLTKEGHEVTYMCFSYCDRQELKDEASKALAVLDVKNMLIRDMPVRHFQEYRQKILDLMMISSNNGFDLVFCPSSDDIHQDHQVVNQEAKRAFKHTRLLGYEMPWNSQGFKGNCFYKVGLEDLQMKIMALGKYKSQEHRNYFDPEFIESLAKVRGVQAGVKFAECFEVIRWYE